MSFVIVCYLYTHLTVSTVASLSTSATVAISVVITFIVTLVCEGVDLGGGLRWSYSSPNSTEYVQIFQFFVDTSPQIFSSNITNKKSCILEHSMSQTWQIVHPY